MFITIEVICDYFITALSKTQTTHNDYAYVKVMCKMIMKCIKKLLRLMPEGLAQGEGGTLRCSR